MDGKELSERDLVDIKGQLTNLIPSVSRGFSVLIIENNREILRYSKGKIPELNFTYGENTIFDLASLTKPLITATLTMKMLDSNKISLKDPITSYLKIKTKTNLEKFTFKNLLSHISGLIPGYPLYENGTSRKDYLNIINSISKESVPYKKE